MPDLFMQIRSELGIINPNGDFYQEHIDKIKNNFNIHGNILDVASGRFPAFANRIAKLQMQIQKGTITICDPNLIISKIKYPNMTLQKKELTPKTNIKEFDLITSILPCEATEIVLQKSIEEQKDFYIALCDCSHLDFTNGKEKYMSTIEYHNYLIKKAEKLMTTWRSDSLEVEFLDEKYAPLCPILYNKKR